MRTRLQVRADQSIDHSKFASVPKPLHRMPGMQSAILVVTCHGVVIKRQSWTPCTRTLPNVGVLVVFSLPIHPADHEQIRKHLERIDEQTDTTTLTVLYHMHRNGLYTEL